jgi:hypothetical protein
MILCSMGTDLVITHYGRDDRGSQPRSHADAESANQATNENVPYHVLVSIP